ncbi:MAG: hypothetical protein EPN39_17570 [Chitinophagaceae bacterium]|nr:MAG: hypothetical protein EPN39_17570 [Chitinophagaceae bacterium]
MKINYVNIFLLLFFMTTSCNSTMKNISSGNLKFNWSIAGNIPGNSNGQPSLGLAGPIAGISNNVLIIGGGANFPDGMPWEGGEKEYYNNIYFYRRQGDSLVNIKEHWKLPYNLAYSANCSTSKGIVAAGGENESGPLSKVLLINWNESTRKPEISYLPDLPRPYTDGAVAVNKDEVYFAGGLNTEGVSNQFYVLNLDDWTAGWRTLPELPKPVSHSVLYVQSNGHDTCIYLVGGRREIKDSISDLYNEVYQFDLRTKQWSQKASLPYALSAHTGISWGDSDLLVFSGDEGKTFHATEILLMKLAKEKDPDKKKLLIAEKNALQKSHPGYNGNVLLYNTHSDRWIKTDSIPFSGQVTTTAIKWNNDIIIPCGEIKAGVRTPDIILGKGKP